MTVARAGGLGGGRDHAEGEQRNDEQPSWMVASAVWCHVVAGTRAPARSIVHLSDQLSRASMDP